MPPTLCQTNTSRLQEPIKLVIAVRLVLRSCTFQLCRAIKFSSKYLTFEMYLRRWSRLGQERAPQSLNLLPTARRRRSGFEIVTRPIVHVSPALGKGLLPATQSQKLIECSVLLHCAMLTIPLHIAMRYVAHYSVLYYIYSTLTDSE